MDIFGSGLLLFRRKILANLYEFLFAGQLCPAVKMNLHLSKIIFPIIKFLNFILKRKK